MLADILAWLEALPPVALYAALTVFAALENVFPPIPADTVVAFGAFLAARGEASLPGAFLATWAGNVAGALFMYWVGRRLGASQLERRFPTLGDRAAQKRVLALHARWGVAALFVSRFLPAARAVVPPLAGALRLPFVSTAVAMAAASAVWYGAIAVIAYRVGTNFDRLLEQVGSVGRWVGAAAVAVVVVVGVVLWTRWRARRVRRDA